MKSPFPGMDPYLEAYWLDVHGKLVTYAADSLNATLPRGFVARTQERVGIESDAGDSETVIPDVGVVRTASHKNLAGSGALESLASFKLIALDEVPVERYIEVIRVDGLKLITVVEFLSPSNKSTGRKDFIEKRKALLAAEVNFVEIDLTRSGEWRKLLLPQTCPAEAIAPYRYTIRIPQESKVAYLQPITLREPLPDVPIPLLEGDRPAVIPLQSLIERAYANGRYSEVLRYDLLPAPPLDEADAAWARELITIRSRSAS